MRSPDLAKDDPRGLLPSRSPAAGDADQLHQVDVGHSGESTSAVTALKRALH
jgi:hypothetical protein